MFAFRPAVVLTALLMALPAESQSPELDREPPEVITSFTVAGTVDFPHSMHASDFEIECVTCHHETNAAALSIPHQEYFDDFWIECQTCHLSEAPPASPQACSACHHSSPTTIADETLSAKVVIHRSCFECHEGGTGRDASRGCSLCHKADASDAKEGDQHG
ncbi:MAG: hypothetical protein GY769_06010 [bacterium]|nr:hypothetical protein [bacterium]